MKILQREKRAVTAGLVELTTPGHRTRYFRAIPLKQIQQVLGLHGLKALQEDQTEFSGFFCGATGDAFLDLGYGDPDEDGRYEIVKNACLALQWYKMESGRYEITTYLSS